VSCMVRKAIVAQPWGGAMVGIYIHDSLCISLQLCLPLALQVATMRFVNANESEGHRSNEAGIVQTVLCRRIMGGSNDRFCGFLYTCHWLPPFCPLMGR